MTPTHSRSAADMRRLLPAAGRLLGVHIYVTDGTDWAFDDDTVTVGEDFFTRDGHSVREAEALTLVTLWRLIRLPRIEPVMVLRRSRLGAQLPEVEPLLNAIDICIASARTARAFPAASPWISAAFTRRLDANMLDAEPTELPKHAQFVSCLIDHICGSSQMRFSPEIHAALENQPHDAPTDLKSAVRYILDQKSTQTSTPTWEALYAVLRTPFQNFLQEDRAEQGLTHTSSTLAVQTQENPDRPNISESDTDVEADSEAESPEARAAAHKDASEGADLFTSEQTALVERMLPTPLSLTDVVAAALDAAHRPVNVSAQSSASNVTLESQSRSISSPSLGAVAYASRAKKYAREINELRELWMRLTSSQVRPQKRRSARAIPEGSELATETLAHAIAETRAGVRKPHAFIETFTKPRRRDNIAYRDYVFLIDRSASMQGATAEYTADAVLILLEALAGLSRDITELQDSTDTDLGLGIRSALVLFDEHYEIVKPLSTGLNSAVRREFHEKIQLPQGATRDGLALEAAEKILKDSPAPATSGRRKAHIVLVGDGGTHDAARADAQLKHLRSSGISVTAVGIGAAGQEMIHRFSPDGYWVPAPRELPKVFRKIISQQVSAQ